MNAEMITSLKNAKSPEEIVKIMRESGVVDFPEETAKMYFNFINKSGELSDEELGAAVGGCKTDGKTVVTCNHRCHHKGWYRPAFTIPKDSVTEFAPELEDVALRKTWAWWTGPNFFTYEDVKTANLCGWCYHLRFTGAGVGYCKLG